MNKQILAVIAIVAVAVVGVTVFRSMSGSQKSQMGENTVADQTSPSPETDTDGDTGESVAIPPEENMMSYTLEDVATHSKAEDCWLVIEGNVYDVTPYIQKQIHPGGAAILFGCGKDATAVFNLRPKDQKAHSQNARNILKDYFVGALTK